ncbi:MAG: membrane protein insertion efficiency factor YidD [Phycisphaerae bacterium]
MMQEVKGPSEQRPSAEVSKPVDDVRDTAAASRASRGIVSRVFALALLFFIRVYQVTLSPLLGGHCRYEPTCSIYAIEAIKEHGPWRGGWLALTRLLRCHPFVKGGYDPVPPRRQQR